MNLEEAKQEFKQALGLFEKNEFDQAIAILEMLSCEIDPTIDNLHLEIYAQVRLVLVFIYEKKGNLKRAIEVSEKFLKENKRLCIFQWVLVALYLDIGNKVQFFKIIGGLQNDDMEHLGNIHYLFTLYKNIEVQTYRDKLIELHLIVNKILNLIVISQIQDQWIAHYTTPSVAYLMLDHKNHEQVSKFRLNPTDFMNDPKEGVLIDELFSLKAQEKPNAQIEKHKSFIGCFTLHHDSLNQFRLYGKENQREASGVSLVLNREQLFERESNFTFLTHNLSNFQKESVDLGDVGDSKGQQQSTDLKLPLFRCIYFDPDSGLIHVAQREEWTFCREKGSCQDNGWEEYKLKIDQVNKSVRELILDIQQLIMNINPAENSDEAELIEEILLPLRYLIKHYAFKEEQECRTIYITQWNDEKIQLDPNLKRVYVDYQSILPAMEKIFLSVGALQHESALQYLGQTTTKKFAVKRSHNPFRT